MKIKYCLIFIKWMKHVKQTILDEKFRDIFSEKLTFDQYHKDGMD